ncbi:MAG TPA: pantoate--beta-alanine ligase [Anaerolineae bacterium]|nr:pantoate--beta-alanine ligase [Anaerolineae bacterium]
MQILTTIETFRQAKSARPGTWGLAPTMGYLHEGHLSLVRRARAENDRVAVSIFVNPTQFGPHEDLAAYPRDLQRDLDLLEPLGVDLVFHPAPEVMYPPHFQTYVTVEEVTQTLEGAARPGHFRGVATVVAKLFNIAQADRAYFGQKDAQQVIVIKRLAADLALPIQIVVCLTVREPDGLAMSSRNTYLDPAQRKAATILHRALNVAKERYDMGERAGGVLRGAMRSTIEEEPLAVIDYVSAADPTTLLELDRVGDNLLLSLAVRIGKPRLIDNFLLEQGQWMTGELASG